MCQRRKYPGPRPVAHRTARRITYRCAVQDIHAQTRPECPTVRAVRGERTAFSARSGRETGHHPDRDADESTAN